MPILLQMRCSWYFCYCCDVNVVYYVSFLVLNDPFIPGISPIRSWCIVLLICSWIQCPGFFVCLFEDFCTHVYKEWESPSVLSESLWPPLNSPWNSLGQNTGMVSLYLLHGSFRGIALQMDSLLSEPQGKPKNTGVGSLSLLQGIFPTQESNGSLLNCNGFFTNCNFPFYVIPFFYFVIEVMLGYRMS